MSTRFCIVCPWGKDARGANVAAVMPLLPAGVSCTDIAGTDGGSIPPDPNAGAWECTAPAPVADAIYADPRLTPLVVYMDRHLPPGEPPTQDGFDTASAGLARLLGVTLSEVQAVVG